MRNDSPFAGPKPLDRHDPIHGRGRELLELTNLLISRRIVLLYSPSGAGKSSLIDAQGGLLDRVGRGQAEPLLEVRPITRVQTTPPAGLATNRFAWSALNGLGIPPNASLAESVIPTVKRPTLIVFDQFEEILRADPAGMESKRLFFEQLGDLLLDNRIWALFALREDYLAQLDPYRVLLPTRLETRYRIDLLLRDDAADAIQQTATAAGVPFATDALGKLLDDLTLTPVQQPDRSFSPQPVGPVEPLQLQLVCGELWRNLAPGAKQIALDDVQNYGDVCVVLGNYYNTVVQDVAGNDQYGLRTWIETQLVSGTHTRAQVLQEAEYSGGLPNAQVDQLVDHYLVRRELRMNATWIELAHDRLVEAVVATNRDWLSRLGQFEQRVRNWTEEKNEDLKAGYLLTGHRLREARDWFRTHPTSPVHDHTAAYLAACDNLQKQNSARRAGILALAILFVAACVAFAVARQQALLAQQREAKVKEAVVQLEGSVTALEKDKSGELLLQAQFQKEIASLRQDQSGLTTDITRLAAESRRLVPQLKTLHAASDALLKQLHDATFVRKQAFDGLDGGVKEVAGKVASVGRVASQDSQSIDDLNKSNVQNRALMTKIIELGIKLPVIPPLIRPTVLSTAMMPVVAFPQPPPFTPSPDEYLAELLKRNAQLLAQAERLNRTTQGLSEQAEALRAQNAKLAAVRDDLREQVTKLQAEVKLLSSVDDLRQQELADLQSTTATLRSQAVKLSNISSASEGTRGLLESEYLTMNELREEVDRINGYLSAAIQQALAKKGP